MRISDQDVIHHVGTFYKDLRIGKKLQKVKSSLEIFTPFLPLYKLRAAWNKGQIRINKRLHFLDLINAKLERNM